MEFVIGKTINFKRTQQPDGQGVPSRGAKGDDRVITGICSVFGNVDAGGDVVMPGAFAKSLQDFRSGNSRCRFLWNHSSKEPPTAMILDLKALSKSELPPQYRNLPDVEGALVITRKYFTDGFSDRVYQGVASKAISEMSFAYNVKDFEYEHVKGQKVRLLKSLELLDASDVNWGMNPATSAAVGKNVRVFTSAEIDQMAKGRKELAKLKEQAAQLDYDLRQTNPEYAMSRLSQKLDRVLNRANQFVEVKNKCRSL